MRVLHKNIVACTLGLLLLAACGTEPAAPVRGTEVFSTPLDEVKRQLSLETLSSLEYSVTDPTLREMLSRTGHAFSVRMKDGAYRFPPAALMEEHADISLDARYLSYGDVDGDSLPDAIVPLTAGTGETSFTELAVVSLSGSSPLHIASFPLGHASLQDVRVLRGSIHVRFLQAIAGDLGPKTIELVLSLPSE